MKTRPIQIKMQCVMVTDFDLIEKPQNPSETIGGEIDNMLAHYSEAGWKPNKIVVDLCPPTQLPEDMNNE